jgi:hypothetical protein
LARCNNGAQKQKCSYKFHCVLDNIGHVSTYLF